MLGKIIPTILKTSSLVTHEVAAQLTSRVWVEVTRGSPAHQQSEVKMRRTRDILNIMISVSLNSK